MLDHRTTIVDFCKCCELQQIDIEEFDLDVLSVEITIVVIRAGVAVKSISNSSNSCCDSSNHVALSCIAITSIVFFFLIIYYKLFIDTIVI